MAERLDELLQELTYLEVLEETLRPQNKREKGEQRDTFSAPQDWATAPAEALPAAAQPPMQGMSEETEISAAAFSLDAESRPAPQAAQDDLLLKISRYFQRDARRYG